MDTDLTEQTNAIDIEIADIRRKTELGGEEIGRRLTPLYEKKLALLNRQRELAKPEQEAEWDRARAVAERGDVPPEVAQAEVQATNDLRGKWGADYDRNFQIVSEQLNKVFKGDSDAFAHFMVANGIDIDPRKQVEYSEFLLKMARKKF